MVAITVEPVLGVVFSVGVVERVLLEVGVEVRGVAAKLVFATVLEVVVVLVDEGVIVLFR